MVLVISFHVTDEPGGTFLNEAMKLFCKKKKKKMKKRSETELTASILKKRSKTHKRLHGILFN